MKFKLVFDIAKSDAYIKYGQAITSLGSCFANNMTRKFLTHKFNVIDHKLGTLYNPYAIFNLIKKALHKTYPKSVLIDGMHMSFDLHSDIRAAHQTEFSSLCESRMNMLHRGLKESEWLIITLGTAWTHTYLSTNNMVANCHKLPQTLFKKELLSVDFILQEFEELQALLNPFNPKLKILFTVSPVRHTKDGLHENTLSKATLHLAVQAIVKKFSHTYYFPAYEIMIDELRDYRFYKTDLIHPNELAIDYIWDQLTHTYFDETTFKFYEELKVVLKSIGHRPFNPNSDQHQKFIIETLNKTRALSDTIDLTTEIEQLTKLLR
jgi:hypothetical protein